MSAAGSSISAARALQPEPKHDVDLSKLLSKLLRHKAIELSVPISPEGWISVPDVVDAVNSQALREIVGNATTLRDRMYTVEDLLMVREADNKQRFEFDRSGPVEAQTVWQIESTPGSQQWLTFDDVTQRAIDSEVQAQRDGSLQVPFAGVDMQKKRPPETSASLRHIHINHPTPSVLDLDALTATTISTGMSRAIRQQTLHTLRIKAAQGHTMAGIAETVGEALTLETAPKLAVHGSYLIHRDSILSNGLRRMARHHIHLAQGLIGERGVISGMRHTAELFVWVNVHEAISSGIRFFRSANGVLLCDGTVGVDGSGDGCLPSSFFTVVIEVRGGLSLHPAQVRLIERLFSGCSRVAVTALHGGFSGSMVLKTDSYTQDAAIEEPSVVKLDSALAVVEEVKRTDEIGALVGADAIRVMRGPLFVDQCGEPKSADCGELTAADFGAVVLEMAGACWVLPEFFGKIANVQMISTFRHGLVSHLESNGVQRKKPSGNETVAVPEALDRIFQELWGAGGPLSSMALKTAQPDSKRALETGGFIESQYQSLVESLIIAFLAPRHSRDCERIASAYSNSDQHTLDQRTLWPPCLVECVEGALKNHPDWLEGVLARDRFVRMYASSFVLQCEPSEWKECDDIANLLKLMHALLSTDPMDRVLVEHLQKQGADFGWLADWQPLKTYQHGDLNASNVLVDVQNSLWLIDFAKAGMQYPFVDCVKMISVLLFEHFPIPISFAEVKAAGVQRLVDIFSIDQSLAEEFAAVLSRCQSRAELVKSLEKQPSKAQRFVEGTAGANSSGGDSGAPPMIPAPPPASSGAKVSAQRLLQLLPRIASDHECERCRADACHLVDALFAPTEGIQPPLWELARRKPRDFWPSDMQTVFQCCTGVLKRVCGIVAQCSASRADGGAAQPADLHPCTFWLPLLVRALCSIRYVQIGNCQKCVAWHAAKLLARLSVQALGLSPSKPPKLDIGMASDGTMLLAEGQPVLVLQDADGRLHGGEGATCLGRCVSATSLDADADAAPSQQVSLIVDGSRMEGYTFDSISHIVLPWDSASQEKLSMGEAFDRICARASKEANEVLTLLVSLETMVPKKEQIFSSAQLDAVAEDMVAKLSALKPESPGLAYTVKTLLDGLETERQEVKEKRERKHIESLRASYLGQKAQNQEVQHMDPVVGAELESIDRQIKADIELQYSADLRSTVEVEKQALQEEIESWSERELRGTGGAGLRRYSSGQVLMVYVEDEWLIAMVAELRALFETLDGDGDGLVTSQEWGKGLAKNREQIAKNFGGGTMAETGKAFKRIDADSSGDLTWEEFVVARASHAKGGANDLVGPTHMVVMETGGGIGGASASEAIRAAEQRLHPWNHAPSLMPLCAFEDLRLRHMRAMRARHASIVDALSGRRLDVNDQCVPIELSSMPAAETGRNVCASLASITDVSGLGAWLCAAHKQRLRGDASEAACILLTAPPAAGKTCLISQLVMHTERAGEHARHSGLVPIVVKVQHLQKRLLDDSQRPLFARSWNWIDAYLQCVHGEDSPHYHMLRQAMMCRRALLLLDGIDEGGKVRGQIERHVTNVLARQGHVMLVTSRPAGLRAELFAAHFHRLQLRPLTEAQQQMVIIQRVGAGPKADALNQYLRDKVPIDTETAVRVTGNPLMLSMVISIFESGGSEAAAMPETIAELYGVAATAMLMRVDRKERGALAAAATVPHLTRLLESTFFQAHVRERRLIEVEHIEAAALEMVDAERLKAIQWPEYSERAEKGHYVQVQRGDDAGKRGVVEVDDKSWIPYRVRFSDGKLSGPIPEGGVLSSGLSLDDFERSYGREVQQQAIRAQCDALPEGVRRALDCIHERVLQDRLPLLSLLQGDPLQMQSSHLSFQEFYTALAISKCGRAISKERTAAGDNKEQYALPQDAAPPWRFSAWWSNTLRLGIEMGDDFRIGLVHVAGLVTDVSYELGSFEGKRLSGVTVSPAARQLQAAGKEGIPVPAPATIRSKSCQYPLPLFPLLDLKGRIGGHRPTALLAVSEMMRLFASVDLTACSITDTEAQVFIAALHMCPSITRLNLGYNTFREETSVQFIKALENKQLQSLGLEALAIGVEGARAVASLVRSSAVKKMDLRSNRLAGMWRKHETYGALLGTYSTEGFQLIVDELAVNSTLLTLELGRNQLGDSGAALLATALKKNCVLESLGLAGNGISSKGATDLSAGIESNSSLQELSLRENTIGDDGAAALALALKRNARSKLRVLQLFSNELSTASCESLVTVLKACMTLERFDIAQNNLHDRDSAETIGEALASKQCCVSYITLGSGSLPVGKLKGTHRGADTVVEPASSVALECKVMDIFTAVLVSRLVRVNRHLRELDLRQCGGCNMEMAVALAEGCSAAAALRVPNNAPKPGTAAQPADSSSDTMPTAATETSTPSTTLKLKGGAIQCTPDDTVWSDGLHLALESTVTTAPSRQATDGEGSSRSRDAREDPWPGMLSAADAKENATKVVTWNVREADQEAFMELEQAWVQLDDRWTTNSPDLDVKERADGSRGRTIVNSVGNYDCLDALGLCSIRSGYHHLRFVVTSGFAFLHVGVADNLHKAWGYNPYFGRFRERGSSAGDMMTGEEILGQAGHKGHVVDMFIDMEQRRLAVSVNGVTATDVTPASLQSCSHLRAWVSSGQCDDEIHLEAHHMSVKPFKAWPPPASSSANRVRSPSGHLLANVGVTGSGWACNARKTCFYVSQWTIQDEDSEDLDATNSERWDLMSDAVALSACERAVTEQAPVKFRATWDVPNGVSWDYEVQATANNPARDKTILIQTNQATGTRRWIKKERGHCLSGCKGFTQSERWIRWRCLSHDYDLCAMCHAARRKGILGDLNLVDMGATDTAGESSDERRLRWPMDLGAVPQLYVGLRSATDHARLLGVDTVLVVGKAPSPFETTVAPRQSILALGDLAADAILNNLPAALNLIDKGLQHGAVLIASEDGASEAYGSAIAVAWLISRQGQMKWGPDEAFARVQAARPSATLHPNSLKHLRVWSKGPEFPGFPDWMAEMAVGQAPMGTSPTST